MKEKTKKIKWRWDYSVYMCFCPYCNEPAYEQQKCVFCGKKYKWIEPKHKERIVQVGDYKVVQSTNNHVSIYGKDGSWLFHAQCQKKLTEEELKNTVKLFLKVKESVKSV